MRVRVLGSEAARAHAADDGLTVPRLRRELSSAPATSCWCTSASSTPPGVVVTADILATMGPNPCS